MKKINQLDLFSGIGGFHLGFEKAGYKVNSYFSEIDKHAIAVYKNQFKNSTYVGSVVNLRGNELPTIDLITFGSPCQDFSLAGKRKGMEGDRSSLILEAIRLIRECRPRVFIWENVKGTFSSNNGEDFAAIIQEFANIGGYRLEWQLLNTSWFLPQNRERIYLVGYSATTKRDWRGVFPIAANEREALELQGQCVPANTILQRYTATANGTYICERELTTQVKQIGTRLDSGGKQPYQQDRVYDSTGEATALNASKSDLIVRVKSATSNGYEIAEEGDSINLSNPNSKTRRGRVGKGKANTLETSCNQAVVQAGRIIGRNPDNPKSRVPGLPTEQMLEVNKNDHQTNTLTSVQKDNVVLEPNYRIRRLTPIECERLQGFPDNHTKYGNYDGEVKEVSNTQRYKQCGNAVTVDVVQAIAEKIKPLF